MAAHAVARLRHTLSVELGADTSLRHFRNVSWHQELGFGRGETETGRAWIRSINVPCGTRSTSRAPDIICCWAAGLSPIWLTMALPSSLARTSLPIPTLGDAVSLAITVRFFCLGNDLVDHALRRSDAHEAADHHAGAVGDHGGCLIETDGLHIYPEKNLSRRCRLCEAGQGAIVWRRSSQLCDASELFSRVARRSAALGAPYGARIWGGDVYRKFEATLGRHEAQRAPRTYRASL